jgi:hypothetical protein
MNNLNLSHISPHQSIRNSPTPHDSMLFSPHSEPALHTAHNIQTIDCPLFLNSPTTMNLHYSAPVAQSHTSFKNHCSSITHSPSFENRCSPNAHSPYS